MMSSNKNIFKRMNEGKMIEENSVKLSGILWQMLTVIAFVYDRMT